MKKKIINFAIIAHVDSGKTTLSNKIAAIFGLKNLNTLKEEAERSITVKARTIRLETETTIFNLVDTPGHMDFSGQVDSFLEAVENSVLVLDGTEGVQSQTMNKLTIAKKREHFILPVINKIDLPNVNLEKCQEDLKRIQINTDYTCLVSAKTGEGIQSILDTLERYGKSPKDLSELPTKVLLVDSFFNQYHGIVLIVKVVEGTIKENQELYFYLNKHKIKAYEIGYLQNDFIKEKIIYSGEIGYVITKIKNPEYITSGDTIVENLNTEPLALFKQKKCLVFCLFLLNDSKDFDIAYEALEKIRLTDSSFTVTKEDTTYNGKAFRCGFLGLLHMEIIQSRIFNEFNISLIPTFPLVEYKIQKTNNDIIYISDPNLYPTNIKASYEPECICTIFTENKYIGAIVDICTQKRGRNINILQEESVVITCEIPLSEIITNFSETLQSITNGYCNYNYVESGYRQSNLIVLSVWVNGKIIKELTFFTIKENQFKVSAHIAKKLKEIIEREQFLIKIQVREGFNGKIIASEELSARRKDVIAHCSGGDITRKQKLERQQKEGKDNLFKMSNVRIKKEDFYELVKFSDQQKI